MLLNGEHQQNDLLPIGITGLAPVHIHAPVTSRCRTRSYTLLCVAGLIVGWLCVEGLILRVAVCCIVE